jgi:hypothetical protein
LTMTCPRRCTIRADNIVLIRNDIYRAVRRNVTDDDGNEFDRKS